MARYQQHYRALGSTVLITLVTTASAANRAVIFAKLYSQITAFEQQFSRFLPTSELTSFNQSAGAKTAVSPSFMGLLKTAKQLAAQTAGLYNPFILPALQQAGYLGSWPQPEHSIADTVFTDRQLTTVDQLILGDGWAKIPNTAALDFGGIGKGYLLDQLAQELDDEPLSGYWLSLGGDIICAGHDLNGRDWQVAVQDALDTTKNIETIANQSGHKLAIATSGITKRRGLKDGREWHHLIDPRTGQPARTAILTATVTAKQAVLADVYAKCVVIAGADQAKQYQVAGVIQTCLLQSKNR
jgi:thiamine biosynthesis lipoprotein